MTCAVINPVPKPPIPATRIPITLKAEINGGAWTNRSEGSRDLFYSKYFNQKELGALIMSMHKVRQRQLPLVLIGAGRPILSGLAGESKSYAERLFSFPPIGALTEADARKALQDPALAADISFDAAALTEIFRRTQGYPYFLQEWGYQVWNRAGCAQML